MTIEISLSVMNMLQTETKLRAALDAFEQERGVHINLTVLEWQDGWAELSRYAANEKGPDISEIGSTWLPSLVSMNALWPLSVYEQNLLGGDQTFFPRAWQGVMLKEHAYAVPWFCDSRLLYYRRDLLAKINKTPEQAFASIDDLVATLEAMRQAGIPNLWGVPNARHANNIHIASSWIWGNGGDFFSPDGKKLILDQPEALQGLVKYFETTRYSSVHIPDINDQDLINWFIDGKVAVVPSGPWLGTTYLENAIPEVAQNWGVVPMPGVSFVGGVHLVLWRHSRKRDIAFELLQYLTSEQVQKDLHLERTFLPANQKALEAELAHDTLVTSVSLESLRRGRSFPLVPVWSKVEDRLIAEFNGIWADILALPLEEAARPGVIRKIVEARVELFVRRLNLAISG